LPKEIRISSERCCGCFLCQLICSALHEGAFSLGGGYIQVTPDLKGVNFSIELKEGCKFCFACVQICPTSALTKGIE